jgi:hypothetical protein
MDDLERLMLAVAIAENGDGRWRGQEEKRALLFLVKFNEVPSGGAPYIELLGMNG